eukprot:TRINITY_DN24024_c0_g1_i1.p1 TRINITY_DN24024_c0_g1~~TRINITY_DN24024_c0_g1_i1.p1  ORF type:complete len:317 (-),score=72.75 TRINITY_DN24024_c0_g1_i1:70-1020(-)
MAPKASISRSPAAGASSVQLPPLASRRGAGSSSPTAPLPRRGGGFGLAGAPAPAAIAPSRGTTSKKHTRAGRHARSSTTDSATVSPSGTSSAKEREAAERLQAWYRSLLRRREAARERARLLQMREDEQEMLEAERRREASAEAARQAKAAAKREADAKREAQLRAHRERRCVVEQMCQGLPSHTMDWEEKPSKLVQMLSEPEGSAVGNVAFERWIGSHTSRKAARKQYLQLARKWHPDKWTMQGDQFVAVATDVTKRLIASIERAMKTLPLEPAMVSCEDEDEELEVYEFASWVGVTFDGMFDVWKQRKRVTRGS